MKKWIALLLAAVMCLSLGACGEKSEGNDASSAEITLDSENILNYLNVEITYTKNGEKNILGNPVMEQTITIYPVRGGSFENVQLIILEKVDDWKAKSSEINSSFTQCDNGYTLTKITLPSDGNYTCTHTFDANTGLSKLPANTDSSKGWEYISLTTITEYVEGLFGSDYVKAGDPCIKGTFKEK